MSPAFPYSWLLEPSGQLFFTCVELSLRNPTSIYHFSGLLGNSTTIEGWEKDKVATMVRRGKIREIKFPYVCPSLALHYHSSQYSFPQNLGRRKNVESILGTRPLLWCWPTVTPGTGLKYGLSDGDGKWIELSTNRVPYGLREEV